MPAMHVLQPMQIHQSRGPVLSKLLVFVCAIIHESRFQFRATIDLQPLDLYSALSGNMTLHSGARWSGRTYPQLFQAKP